MTLKEKSELSKYIIEQSVRQYDSIFAACSFGKDSRVIVDLCMKIKSDIAFVSIDTGYEFPETLSFADGLIKQTGMNLEWARPSEEDVARIEEEFGNDFVKNNQYKCCAMKLPAISPFIQRYDAWISGLRRDETETRKDAPLVQYDKEITKINPIAFWTKDDVWEYIHENKLSYHPLYDQGYVSLGCKPCTKKPDSSDKKNERSGRFTGTSNQGKECGLHK